MSIREAKHIDARQIAEVHNAAWQAAYDGLVPHPVLEGLDLDHRARSWERNLEREESVTLVATDSDSAAVVGFSVSGPDRDASATDPLVGEIEAIYVHPDRWRQGIGRSLLIASQASLQDRGFAEAVVWVLAENVRARRFYEGSDYRFDNAEKETEIGKPLQVVRYRTRLGDALG